MVNAMRPCCPIYGDDESLATLRTRLLIRNWDSLANIYSQLEFPPALLHSLQFVIGSISRNQIHFPSTLGLMAMRISSLLSFQSEQGVHSLMAEADKKPKTSIVEKYKAFPALKASNVPTQLPESSLDTGEEVPLKPPASSPAVSQAPLQVRNNIPIVHSAPITDGLQSIQPFDTEQSQDGEFSKVSITLNTPQPGTPIQPEIKGTALPSASGAILRKSIIPMQTGIDPSSLQSVFGAGDQVICRDSPQLEPGSVKSGQRRLWFKPNCHWPEPEASIGESFLPLGANQCWEVKGPALEIWLRISPEVKKIVACCDEDLNAEESASSLMICGMFMVGKDERKAVPTILVCCESRTARQKAMEIIKEIPLLQEYKTVIRFAKSAKPPIRRNVPRLIASDGAQTSVNFAGTDERKIVYMYAPDWSDKICGVPISIQYELGGAHVYTREATIGGILRKGNTYYGLTVAHPFLERQKADPTLADSFEFSFDDSTDSGDEMSGSNPPILTRPDIMTNNNEGILIAGFVDTLSPLKVGLNLDWALIDVEPSFFKVPNRVRHENNVSFENSKVFENMEPFRLLYPKSVANMVIEDCQILASTGSRGTVEGTLSGVPYFIKMPSGKNFQQVGLVRLKDTVELGDCGSWIIDLKTGDLYGHIVAGYPQSRIAFIIPATDIFQDIRQRLGDDITLSSVEHVQESGLINERPKGSFLWDGDSALGASVYSDRASSISNALSIYDSAVSGSDGALAASISPELTAAIDLPRPQKNLKMSGGSALEISPILESKEKAGSHVGILPNFVPRSFERRSKYRKYLPSSPGFPGLQPGLSIPSEPHDLPDNFGFLWSIDALQATYNEKHPPRIIPIGAKNGNDIGRAWFPPNVKEMFTRRNGCLYRWREWGSEIVNSPRPKKKIEVASVFFQARLDNFVAVFKDCTRYDIKNEDYGWSHLGFHHVGHVTEVDLVGGQDVLAAPAGASSWMPQVLPEVYNYPIRNPSKSFEGEYGGLCGKLSLLIAMAAFSAVEDRAEDVVAKCFQFGEWKEHSFKTGVGRYQNRGVLVTIYLDPEVLDVTKEHIKALEKGSYGPIWASLGDSPSPSPSHYSTQWHTPSISRAAQRSTTHLPRNKSDIEIPYIPSAQTLEFQERIEQHSF